MHKKTILLTLALCISFPSFSCADTPKIAVSQFISHKALNHVYEGLKLGLKEEGFCDGSTVHIIYENAHGNNLTAAQIGTKFRGLKPKVMVGIATPAAQALIRPARIAKSMLFFGAVSDPQAAGLSSAKGVSDAVHLAPLVKNLKTALPSTKTIGVLFSAGEANSVIQVKNLKNYAEKNGLKVIEKSISRTTDAQAGFDVLARKSDVIFTPTDNLIISAINMLIQRSFTLNTPIISSNYEPVEKGALMGVGVDYHLQGKMIGKQIASVLKGAKKFDDLKITTQENIDFLVNNSTAKKMKITLSEEFLGKANKIY